MTEVDAVNEIIYCVTRSAPFSGGHALYAQVAFVPEYPLESMDVPTVAIAPSGGRSRSRGIGTYHRMGWPEFQVDVLAATSLEARRIFQRFRQAVMADYEHDDSSGAVGAGYLKGKHIKSVVIGEPRSATWDPEGRVKRVLASMTVQYLEED
jgi:hypothetical protein